MEVDLYTYMEVDLEAGMEEISQMVQGILE